jgi:hypothetical protein
MGGALADGHHPHLRVCRLVILATAGEPERSGILLRVRGIPLEPVDGHQPPRSQERPPGQLIRGRNRHPGEQLLHRLIPQPLAGLGDPARGRYAPRLIPAAPRGKGLSQPGRDLLIVIVGEQGHCHHEIDHDVRREFPIRPLRLPARSCYRVIDRIPRHRRGQHPQRHPVRQPSTGSHHAILRHRPRSCRQPGRTLRSDTPTQRST